MIFEDIREIGTSQFNFAQSATQAKFKLGPSLRFLFQLLGKQIYDTLVFL